jgi:hypothetical protein
LIELTLVVVGKDDAALAEFGAPGRAFFRMIANDCGESLAAIANRELADTRTAVFGLCHADVVFGYGALDSFVRHVKQGYVCGMVGRDREGAYRCCSRPEHYDRGAGALFTGPGPVVTLDSMAVFFRADSGLRFDAATFDGLHCHVEDLCLQAAERGIPVLVPPANAYHREHAPPHAKWMEEYFRYRGRLSLKWAGKEFYTT